jgi:hypothetical protein
MEARTWTLRAEESDDVMRAELEPNERERVVLEIPVGVGLVPAPLPASVTSGALPAGLATERRGRLAAVTNPAEVRTHVHRKVGKN